MPIVAKFHLGGSQLRNTAVENDTSGETEPEHHWDLQLKNRQFTTSDQAKASGKRISARSERDSKFAVGKAPRTDAKADER